MNPRHSPSSAGDQTQLLLYALGELPANEAAEVDRRLQNDASLRAQLERVHGEIESANAAFAAADDSDILNINRAVFRATSSIHQWQAQRKSAPAAARVVGRTTSHGWLFGAAAAALFALVTIPAINHLSKPNSPEVAQSSSEQTLPAFGPDEDRFFHLGQLEALAQGAASAEDADHPAAELPSSALPPVSVPDGGVGGVASAAATGEPFFDVPLSPDDAAPLP